jgi:DNA-directed RNA polymerase subunit RPC12/RpoP
MKEFTFNCSTCGQPILASKDWEGRQMNCPSCNTRITITAAARPKKRTRLATPAKTSAKPAARSRRPPGFL